VAEDERRLLGALRVRRELRVAVAAVLGAADAGEDPLAHVALEVQQQVADRVAVPPVPPPDLLLVELSDAGPDAWDGLFDDVEAERPGDAGGEILGGAHAGILTVPAPVRGSRKGRTIGATEPRGGRCGAPAGTRRPGTRGVSVPTAAARLRWA